MSIYKISLHPHSAVNLQHKKDLVFSQQDTKRNLDGEQFCEIFPAGVEAGDVPDFEFSLWSSDESCPLESILTRLLWGDALTESDVKLVEEEDLFLLEVTGQLEINIIDFRFTFASQHYFVYEKRKTLNFSPRGFRFLDCRLLQLV